MKVKNGLTDSPTDRRTQPWRICYGPMDGCMTRKYSAFIRRGFLDGRGIKTLSSSKLFIQ